MKHNLLQRGLVEYKVGLFYLLGRIMGRVKDYIIRKGETFINMVSEDYIKHNMVARVPRSQPGK